MPDPMIPNNVNPEDFEIDENGNLVIKNIDPAALDELRKKLEDAKADAQQNASIKFRVEAFL